MTTWTHTCGACQRGDHDNCDNPSKNPCDCATNGHE